MEKGQVTVEWECAKCRRMSERRHPVDASVREIEAKRPQMCQCEQKTEFKFHGIKAAPPVEPY